MIHRLMDCLGTGIPLYHSFDKEYAEVATPYNRIHHQPVRRLCTDAARSEVPGQSYTTKSRSSEEEIIFGRLPSVL